MDALNQLLSSYPPGTVLMVVLLVVACIKFFGPAFSWMYSVAHSHFKREEKISNTINEHEKIDKALEGLAIKVDNLSDAVSDVQKQAQALSDKIDDLDIKNDKLQEQLGNVASLGQRNDERLMEYMKAFVIDRYHYYCFQAQRIDDISLQYLEICYSHLQSDKDASYLEGLMTNIRNLPRINLENSYIFEGGK